MEYVSRGVSFTNTTDTIARIAPHLTTPKLILIDVGVGTCNRKTAL